MHNWNIHTLWLAKFPYRFPNLWSEELHCKKVEEATKLHPSRSIENQGIFYSPGGITEINATISDVKIQGFDSHHISIQPTYVASVEDRWLLKNDSGLSEA